MLRTIEEAKECTCPVFYNSNVKAGEVGDSLKCRAHKCMAWEVEYVCDKCDMEFYKEDFNKQCNEALKSGIFHIAVKHNKDCDGIIVEKGYCKLIFKGEEVE